MDASPQAPPWQDSWRGECACLPWVTELAWRALSWSAAPLDRGVRRGVLKPRPPPPTLVSLSLSSGRNETSTGPGCSQGRLSAGSQVGAPGRHERPAVRGGGPGLPAGRACWPLALGSWSCPGPAGSVKVDRADRLAFGPQLCGVMGDGGSVLALSEASIWPGVEC